MHHRYYHPRLGHFLTPDFRAPDIYDPSTFTELYAYAAGNPVMFRDPDGLAEELGGSPQSKPGSADYILHYLRYALYWGSSHSESFYQTRDNAAQALAVAQAATLNKKDQVVASLEQNRFELMEPGFELLSAATDFYGDRALLWILGAGHGGLNYGENTVATASMVHNGLVLGIDQIGIVDPSISGQASQELAPIVSVFEERGVIPVIVEGVVQPFVELGTNMSLAQEGDYQAEFDFVAGGTELGLEFAPAMLMSGGSGAPFQGLSRLQALPRVIAYQSRSVKRLYYGLRLNRIGSRRTFYHGVKSPKSSFARGINPNKGGGQLGDGFYATDDISTALWYAHDDPARVFAVKIAKRDFKKLKILEINRGTRIHKELVYAFRNKSPIPEDILKLIKQHDAVIAPLRIGPTTMSNQIKFNPSVVHKLWVR